MKVTAFLTQRFETVEAFTVIDILRRAGIDIDTVSITNEKSVTSAQKVTVLADYTFDEYNFSETDLFFLPGGPGHKNYEKNSEFLDILKEAHKNKKRIAAICAAPSILGHLGILEGKIATCYPGFEKDLYGAEIADSSIKVVTDGNITTSRGVGTSIELGLELVKLLKGEELSKKIGYDIVYYN